MTEALDLGTHVSIARACAETSSSGGNSRLARHALHGSYP